MSSCEKLFSELSYFVTKDNAKELLNVAAKIVARVNPPDPNDDIFYDIHRNALWIEFCKLGVDDKPQRKKLWNELEEVIGNGNVD